MTTRLHDLEDRHFTGRIEIDPPIKVKLKSMEELKRCKLSCFFDGSESCEQIKRVTMGREYEIHAVEGFGDMIDVFVTDDFGEEYRILSAFWEEVDTSKQSVPVMEFGAAFIQKPLDEGLTKSEVSDLFDMLKGVSAIPFEVQSENAVAMGFVNRTDAELMEYDMRPLEAFVREILSDTAKENETGRYEFPYDGVGIIDVYIGYQIED